MRKGQQHSSIRPHLFFYTSHVITLWYDLHLCCSGVDRCCQQVVYLKSCIFAHVQLLRSKIFFVDFDVAPKARFWRDCHVTPKRHICDVLAVIWPKSRVNRPTRKDRSAAYKTPTVKCRQNRNPMLSLWESKYFSSTLVARRRRIFGAILTWPPKGTSAMY